LYNCNRKPDSVIYKEQESVTVLKIEKSKTKTLAPGVWREHGLHPEDGVLNAASLEERKAVPHTTGPFHKGTNLLTS
jgi:hypothetical protein